MFKSVLIIAKKELLEIVRDKSTFVLFTLPIILFSFMGISIQFFAQANAINEKIQVAYINSNGGMNSSLEKFIKENQVDILNTNTKQEAESFLKDSKISCIIEEKEDKSIVFTYNSSSLLSRITTTNLLSQYDIIKQKMENENNKNFVLCYLQDENGFDGNDSSTLFLLIMPAFFVMLTCGATTAFANDLFAGEKERNTLELLLLSNVNKISLFLGKALTLCTICLIDFLVCLISYVGFLGAYFNISFINICLIAIVLFTMIMVFSFLTLLISLISFNRRMSQILNEIICGIPVILMFLIILFDYHQNIGYYIPILNSLVLFWSIFVGHSYSLISAVSCILINFFVCGIITVVAKNYLCSEKVLD